MFIFYLLRSIETDISKEGTGSTFSAINKQFIEKLEFSLPPLNEQHRIVAKIEELFSELDKGIENLKTAQAQLKVYRQALLKHAFEGKLTHQWRAANPDKLEPASALLARIQTEREQRYQQQLQQWENAGGSKPKAPKPLPPLTKVELAELPELPEGWAWVWLEALVTGVDQGWSPKCEGHSALDTEWGVIKTTAIQHGRFDSHENKSLPFGMEPREQHELRAGDILVTRAGPRVRVGVCCLVRTVRQKLMNCDKAYRIRAVDSLCRSDYLEAVLNSPRVLDAIEQIKSGINDSGVNLNQGAFLGLAIPFCDLEEQSTLIQELESKISEAEQLDQTLTTSLQQAEALRQSILKRAFSGQLVAQDTNDEPASVLLARIKSEKAAAMAKPRKPKQAAADPTPEKSNVIPFPVRTPNISATDLQAGILARAYQHHENAPKYLGYFGHVKAEKIAHMVEAYLGIDLEREPIKDAAGPNDYPHLMKVESRARKANWFDVKKKKDADAYALSKKHGFDALLLKTMKALGERAEEVDALINLLLPLNSRQSEIVATLYAAWNNLLLQGQTPDDEAIVQEARENWHASKLKIERDRFFRGLRWMREHGLVPTGRGRFVAKKS